MLSLHDSKIDTSKKQKQQAQTKELGNSPLDADVRERLIIRPVNGCGNVAGVSLRISEFHSQKFVPPYKTKNRCERCVVIISGGKPGPGLGCVAGQDGLRQGRPAAFRERLRAVAGPEDGGEVRDVWATTGGRRRHRLPMHLWIARQKTRIPTLPQSLTLLPG